MSDNPPKVFSVEVPDFFDLCAFSINIYSYICNQQPCILKDYTVTDPKFRKLKKSGRNFMIDRLLFIYSLI